MKMVYSGISASAGYAIGYALISYPKVNETNKRKVAPYQVETELERFKFALRQTESELIEIQKKLSANSREADAEMVTCLLLILQDDEFSLRVVNNISQHRLTAEAALSVVTDELVLKVQRIENNYIAERSSDIRDMSQHVMKHLIGGIDTELQGQPKKYILITDELKTSYTAQLDPNIIIGCAAMYGGTTSHAAIIARSLRVPMVVGMGDQISQIQDGQLIILDGVEGKLYTDPDEAQITYFNKLLDNATNSVFQTHMGLSEPVLTLDQYPIEIWANIDSTSSAEEAKRKGASGVGLFRTEFLYLNKHIPPSEQEQFEIYRQIAIIFGGNAPITIRTFDIGGDKQLRYGPATREINPLSGYRGIRFGLDQVELFKIQLRAILRASLFGQIKIMFPMVALLKEWRKAKAILTEVKEELTAEGISFNANIEVGMMIEVPAAALNIEQFAQEADFFSIGTNDLIQFMMAGDRGNALLSYLNNPLEPSTLRLIHHVIRAAHDNHKSISLCGDMAGQPLAITLLLGMGLTKFSMNACDMALAKETLRKLSYSQLEGVTKYALNCEDASEVESLLINGISDL